MVVVFGQIACQFCCSRSLIFVVFFYPIIHCFADCFGNGFGWVHIIEDVLKRRVPLGWFGVVWWVVVVVVHDSKMSQMWWLMAEVASQIHLWRVNELTYGTMTESPT